MLPGAYVSKMTIFEVSPGSASAQPLIIKRYCLILEQIIFENIHSQRLRHVHFGV